MRSIIFLAFLFLSQSLLASANQKLINGQWSYYGQEFYSRLASRSPISKDILYQIFNSYHTPQNGRLDVLSNSCVSDCYRYTSVGYDEARKILFGELFMKKDRDGSFVVEVYCAKKVHFKQVSDISHMSGIVNIEHTWPQSKFNRSYSKELQKSDMHHLYPTDSDANNRRANYSFGDIGDRPTELNVIDCEASQMAEVAGQYIFSPPADHRGNVARSLFYFASRYELEIDPVQEKFLREWHKSDPVDANERARHEIIASYQKSRNPFVDHPELVDKISDF